jgi:hypothetical protein
LGAARARVGARNGAKTTWETAIGPGIRRSRR